MPRKPKAAPVTDATEEPVVEEAAAPEEAAPEAAAPEEAAPEADPRQAKPMAVEAKRVNVPKRNLAGQYVCKTCLNKDGTKHYPGTTLVLTDAEARHYLQHEAVEPLD